MGIGQSIARVDALDKVTGDAKFVEDLLPVNHLVAMCLGSTVAHGRVIAIDVEEAKALEGVECVLTCFDIPQNKYPTAGHPFSLIEANRDIADKTMLTDRVLYVGDDIAVVVAKDTVTAEKALSLIHVKYEEYPTLLDTDDASAGKPIHPDLFPSNAFSQLNYVVEKGTIDFIGDAEIPNGTLETGPQTNSRGLVEKETTYSLPQVHACHIENISCFAYMEGKRIVIVTATQTPHIVRRIVSEALTFPLGDIRVIKPYVGGAFGNKQDIYYEPLVAYLSKYLGGRCVSMILPRERTFINSHTRHAMQIKTRAIYGDHHFKLREAEIICDQGAYAAHGHAIAANSIVNFAHLYKSDRCIGKSKSVYSNKPSGGALRAYGIPQITFAMESFADEFASRLGEDPLEFRLNYMVRPDYVDPFNGIRVNDSGLEKCIRRGAELAQYYEKRDAYSKVTSVSTRPGIGMAIFIYTTGLGRIALETSSIRMILNQDGSIVLQTGAVDFGQGSDTVLAQMASEVLKIPEEKIHVVSMQDTDVCPYDIGTYSSRVTYVAGSAVKQTAELLKSKILSQAAAILSISAEDLDVRQQCVVRKRDFSKLISFSDLAYASLYDTERSTHITAESTYCMRNNAFSFGVCFADIEVDIPVGVINVKRLTSVFDSGKIINPQLAKAQVHGGISMGIGYALLERMIFDKTGRMLNNNFLDYKIPTVLDMPEMVVDFVETMEPTAPFGNKSLGEPPTIAVAPAIRNALFHATGVAMNSLPMTPQRVLSAFAEAGLV